MVRPCSARSTSGLRGNYEAAAADYTVAQDCAGYTPAMHDRWRRLYARQSTLAARYAAPQFLSGLARLDCARGIPSFVEANRILEAATGWRIVTDDGEAEVYGSDPSRGFMFTHASGRRVWDVIYNLARAAGFVVIPVGTPRCESCGWISEVRAAVPSLACGR